MSDESTSNKSKRLTVDGVKLDRQSPTEVGFGRLRSWVIWQFPRPSDGGFQGAVMAPDAGHGWIPAEIYGRRRRVLVYGHLANKYPTPEAAAEALGRHLKKSSDNKKSAG